MQLSKLCLRVFFIFVLCHYLSQVPHFAPSLPHSALYVGLHCDAGACVRFASGVAGCALGAGEGLEPCHALFAFVACNAKVAQIWHEHQMNVVSTFRLPL